MPVHSARERFHSLLRGLMRPSFRRPWGTTILARRGPIADSQVRSSPMGGPPREGLGTFIPGIRDTLSTNLPRIRGGLRGKLPTLLDGS
jgi:hypothetical protein